MVADASDPIRASGSPPPDEADEEEGPVGIFPSWRWVYGVVLVYGTVTILVLWLLTQLLDPGRAS